MKKIYIASDHGGYEMKEELKNFLSQSYELVDLGCDNEESVDYPEFGRIAGEKAVQENTKAIVICGTGIGIGISANKVKGVRCALCTNTTLARLSREHNNANVLALGGRILGVELAKDIAITFLETEFSEAERHVCRILQIEE